MVAHRSAASDESVSHGGARDLVAIVRRFALVLEFVIGACSVVVVDVVGSAVVECGSSIMVVVEG